MWFIKEVNGHRVKNELNNISEKFKESQIKYDPGSLFKLTIGQRNITNW